MVAIVKQWLKRELDGLVNVQTTHISEAPHPDLTVHTWNGVRVHIYLANEPLKIRQMKKLLQDATSVGLATLFIVSADLLPKDTARVIPDEWLLAVHALTGDRVYGYKIDAQGPTLTQVHFEPLNGLNTYEVQYGPSVVIARMRFYRAAAKPRSIKGNWLVADFDTAAFWKENDYRHAREEQARARRRAAGQTSWQTWSGFQTWDNTSERARNGFAASPLRTYLDECYEQLGLKPDADREAVKAAFRQLARAVHPDVSQLPKDEAEAQFKKLAAAYDFIKAANDWA